MYKANVAPSPSSTTSSSSSKQQQQQQQQQLKPFLGIDPAVAHWGSPLSWRTPNGNATSANKAVSMPKALAASLERVGYLEGKLREAEAALNAAAAREEAFARARANAEALADEVGELRRARAKDAFAVNEAAAAAAAARADQDRATKRADDAETMQKEHAARRAQLEQRIEQLETEYDTTRRIVTESDAKLQEDATLAIEARLGLPVPSSGFGSSRLSRGSSFSLVE